MMSQIKLKRRNVATYYLCAVVSHVVTRYELFFLQIVGIIEHNETILKHLSEEFLSCYVRHMLMLLLTSQRDRKFVYVTI